MLESNKQNNVRYLDWLELDEFYTDFSHLTKKFANKSISNKRHVGAVIVDILGSSYYGGYNHIDIPLVNQPQVNKTEMINGQTNHFVFHAEEDAIFNMYNKINSNKFINTYEFDSTKFVSNNSVILFTSYSPCINCAKLIVQSNIQEVVIFNTHKENFDKDILDIDGNILNCSVETFLLANNVDITYIENSPLFTDIIYN